MELDGFIKSEHYSNLLNRLVICTHIELNNNVPDVLFGHDERRIAAGGMDITALEGLLSNDQKVDEIKEFILKSMHSVGGEEEEYPTGGESDKDDRPQLKKKLPYYRSFLITFLVQYYLIENHPDRLDAYYKATRTPAAKKHKKQMLEIYHSVMQ